MRMKVFTPIAAACILAAHAPVAADGAQARERRNDMLSGESRGRVLLRVSIDRRRNRGADRQSSPVATALSWLPLTVATACSRTQRTVSSGDGP